MSSVAQDLREALAALDEGTPLPRGLTQQLQHALEHRVTIERAVGMLMERERLDAVTAFSRLRTTARASRRRVADVAAELLAGAPLSP